MKRRIICAILVLVMSCLLQTVAFAEADFKKIGDTTDYEVYLDKNSIVYYDDFIIVTGKKKLISNDSLIELDSTLSSECYFKYALAKSSHVFKLLAEYAVAEGCVVMEVVSANTPQSHYETFKRSKEQWLEKNWEYDEAEFHKRFDYEKNYDFNKQRWTNFGSDDEVLTLVYDEAMKLAGIKNEQKLEDSGDKQQSSGSATATTSSSSGTNILLVVLAIAVGILGTIIFMQHKNKK